MAGSSFDDWSAELDRRAAAEAAAGDDTRTRLAAAFDAHITSPPAAQPVTTAGRPAAPTCLHCRDTGTINAGTGHEGKCHRCAPHPHPSACGSQMLDYDDVVHTCSLSQEHAKQAIDVHDGLIEHHDETSDIVWLGPITPQDAVPPG